VKILFLGLSITSSWGNGHATNYRGLVRALRRRGHDVLFLERDVPWYAAHRDAPRAGELYSSLGDLRGRFAEAVRAADLVVQGSYVPQGVAVAEWMLETARGVTAFYDIDTPLTLAKLEAGDEEYLAPNLVPRFDLYLSFTGGPTLERLEREWGARRARPFHCLADPSRYRPEARVARHDLGYLGTYSADRQPALERLLLEPARRLRESSFAVAGPGYPRELDWPPNVQRIDHLPPAQHATFYAEQRFTLSITRADMLRTGWSPSVRLFEAAACAVPVISDRWEGLESFFEPGREILVACNTNDVLRHLHELPEKERIAIGRRARRRVLAHHTARHRGEELERHVAELAQVAA
jgi:spore maturation protein CgeB